MARGVSAAKAAEKEQNRLRAVAAVMAVHSELHDSPKLVELRNRGGLVLNVKPAVIDLTCLVATNISGAVEWRRRPFTAGQSLIWTGVTRVSATGTLLFRFLPRPAYANVNVVEIPHTEFKKVFGIDGERSINAVIGDSIGALIDIASKGVAEEDVASAKQVSDPVIVVDVRAKVPEWGAWA